MYLGHAPVHITTLNERVPTTGISDFSSQEDLRIAATESKDTGMMKSYYCPSGMQSALTYIWRLSDTSETVGVKC